MNINDIEKGGTVAGLLTLIGIIVSTRGQLKQAILSARVKESTEMRQLTKQMIDLSKIAMDCHIKISDLTIDNERLRLENRVLKEIQNDKRLDKGTETAQL